MLFQAIALVISLIVIAVLVYYGLSPIYSVIIGCSLMILTNGLGYAETFSNALSLWGQVLMPAVFVTLLGTAIGLLYTKAGACESIALWLMRPIDRVKSQDAKVVLGMLAFVAFRVILGLAGFVNDAVMVTMFAVGAYVFQKLDLDRRHLNAVLVIAGTIGNVLPGAPTMVNVMFGLYLEGYSATAYFIPRLILMIIYIVLVCVIMLRYSRRDRAEGKHFEPGNMMTEEFKGDLPPVWLCFIPIAVVVVTYTIMGVEAWISIGLGLLASIACLYKYFPVEEGKTRFQSIIHYSNDGVILVPLQFMLMVLPSMVMSMSPAFEWGVGALAGLPISKFVSFTILAVVLVSFSGAGAIPTICMAALASFIGNGMGMYQCVIITTWACCVFDSLPTNVSIVIQADLCDCTLKRAYPTIFQTTILATGIITVLAAITAAIGIFGH